MSYATKTTFKADWDDEDTRRFPADAELLAVIRGPATREESSVRKRLDDTRVVAAPLPSPPPPPLPAPEEFVSSDAIRAVFDAYVRVLGPAAKALFAEALRALGAAPSRVPRREAAALLATLARRIPQGAIRERFVAESSARMEKEIDR